MEREDTSRPRKFEPTAAMHPTILRSTLEALLELTRRARPRRKAKKRRKKR
jgi:hypothetical protein